MQVYLHRLYEPSQTVGILTVLKNNKLIFACFTMELKWQNNEKTVSCIPEGTYKVKKRNPTAKFNYPHFEVLNVPNRTAILIHTGNYVNQLQGCIAVGKSFKDLNNDGLIDVTQSKIALAELYEVLPNEFELQIKALTTY